MGLIRISGRVYQDRPPLRQGGGDRLRRLRSIVSSLEFAASQCTEVERRLYKTILESLAHAENAADHAAGEILPEPTLGDCVNSTVEP